MNKIFIIRLFFMITILLIIYKNYKYNLLLDKFDNIEIVSLDKFNEIFNINISDIPEYNILIGVNNNKMYQHIINKSGNYFYVDPIVNYFMINVHPFINKSKYYYMLNYEDGYDETLHSFNGNNIKILTFASYYKNNSNIIPIVDPHYIENFGYSENINIINNNYVNWNNKINKCVWRGVLTNGTDHCFFVKKEGLSPRYYFVNLYNKSKFTNVDYKPDYLSIENQIKYKYILDIDGWVCTWSATIWKLYSGSVLLKQKSVWKQWYYDELIEYVHYVPVANDFSDLNEQIQWCINNDDKCKEITENSRKFVLEKLNWEKAKANMIDTFNNIL